MSTQIPTKIDRDANLDALQKAVDEWAESEKTRIENEVNFMRSVLQGRGAGSRNLAKASVLLQVEIDDFFVFG